MTEPLVRTKPCGGAAPAVLVVLDVDGVLNFWRPGLKGVPVEDADGDVYQIAVNDAVIAALDTQVHRPGVAFAWLTTWEGAVENLITRAFSGRLAGGYVLAARSGGAFARVDWKLTGLLAHLAELGNPPYIWADDVEVTDALLYSPEFGAADPAGGSRLLIETDPVTGLTVSEIERIAEFIDDHTR